LLQVVALVVWSSQPGTTPLAACPTYQVRSSTSAKTVLGDPSCTAPGVCMWPKTVEQMGLQGSRGRGSAPRPRGPPAARPRCTHALCRPHTGPGPAPPAPARASRPHRPPAPARTRPRRPGSPSTRPRTPAPARAPQSSMTLRHRACFVLTARREPRHHGISHNSITPTVTLVTVITIPTPK